MKKNYILLLALLLFVGAVHAQQPDRTYITLVNDDPESVNIDAPTAYLVNYTVSDDINILFARTDSVRVAITTENNDSLFVKDFFYTDDARVQMKYTGIPDGKYWLNVFYEGFWWKGDFEFVSHKPKGLDVYIDSTYYRMNGEYATTVKPDINGRTPSHRMFWNAFERDYPLHVVIPSEITYEGETFQVIGVEGGSFKYCHFLLTVSLPNTITSIGDCAFQGL
ncbi:MAG: hypothetical protein IKP91_02815 [Bacteroidaceae bacterium]|nr:hypothetical protein [Bacteroidaceae bacterium]